MTPSDAAATNPATSPTYSAAAAATYSAAAATGPATDDDTVHGSGDVTKMTRDIGRMTLRSSK